MSSALACHGYSYLRALRISRRTTIKMNATTDAHSGAPSSTFADEGGPNTDTTERGGWSSSARTRIGLLLPGLLVAAVAVVGLLRNDVGAGSILLYASYWLVAVLLPGTLVYRTVSSSPRYRVEELAMGAATGLALDITAWYLLRAVGLDRLVGWWWVPVVGVFAAVPTLRTAWRSRGRSAPRGWSWTMSAITTLTVIAIEVNGFRTMPVPPQGGTLYIDLPWHLAIVNELMRPGSPQIPQVAGEPLSYHFNAHVDMALASDATGLAPELLMTRLWIVPMVIVTLILIATLARQVSGRPWTGPLAVWLSTGALAGGYLWPDRLGAVSTTPLVVLSPSQLIANPLLLVGTSGLVTVARGDVQRRVWPWLLVIAFAGSGAKPTVVAVLLGGTGVVALVALLRERRIPARMLAAAGALFVILVWSLLRVGSGGGGSAITLLGSLRVNRVYSTLVNDDSLRAINDGLLLDSIDDRASIVAAAATLMVIVGFQAVRIIGLFTWVHPRTRRDPASWLLGGAVIAGWAAFLLLDQVGYGQAYFLTTVIPLGATLTAYLLAASLADVDGTVALRVTVAGAAVGALVAALATGIATSASTVTGFGMLDRVVLPALFVTIASVAVAIAWRSRLKVHFAHLGPAFCVAAVIGASIVPSVDELSRRLGLWITSPPNVVNTDARDYLSTAEQGAAIWLREHSEPDDVLATNLHCRPASNAPQFCDARGFWVTGLTGRRAVLEGWGYTSDALARHGEGGRVWALQPSPWPERYELSQAAVEAPTAEVLDTLRREYDVTWIFGVHRASAVSPRLAQLAELAFDNGEVSIYKIRR